MMKHDLDDSKLTVLKWPLQPPDLNTIKHVWDVVEWIHSIMDVQKKGVVGGQGKVSKERSQTRSYPAFASSWWVYVVAQNKICHCLI